MRIAAFFTLPIKDVNLDSRTVRQLPTDGVCTKYNKAAITTLLMNSRLMKIIKEWDDLVRSQIINDLVECALQYDEDVIKNQILVLGDLNHQYANEFEEQEQRLKGALKKLVKSAHEGEAIQEQTEMLKKNLKEPRTQINNTFELVGKKETNIDKNYGPNIENNGTLSLPEALEQQHCQSLRTTSNKQKRSAGN